MLNLAPSYARRIKMFNLWGRRCTLAELLSAIRQNPDMPVLDISNYLLRANSSSPPNALLGSEAASFFAAVQSNTILRKLYIAHQNLGPESDCAIAAILRHNSRLNTLDLTGNNLEEEGATALAKALQHNTVLLNLHLAGNYLGQGGLSAMVEALKCNSTLRMLDLAGNFFGPEKGTLIATLLHHNSTLEVLLLDDNKLGSNSVCAIAKALQHNTSLKELNLSDNDMGSGGATALAEALPYNSSLTTLCLYHNNIGQDAEHALAVALRHNTSMLSLTFYQATTTKQVKTIVDSALSLNKQRSIWINRNRGLQRACIASLTLQWSTMAADEQDAFANTARLLPYLIRLSVTELARDLTKTGNGYLAVEPLGKTPTQVCLESNLGLRPEETSCPSITVKYAPRHLF
jgi:Ran GTPase-activating protein (RanGAP) involved in mRNA processing and transport